MLFLLTILVVLLAGISFTVLVKRRSSNLLRENPPNTLSAEKFRPLFAPDDDDIRRSEREVKAKQQAKLREENRRLLDEKTKTVKDFQKSWLKAPNRRNTIELLKLASQGESGNLYADAAEQILKKWQAGEIGGLSAADLAQMLESHFWLLPVEERTSGVRFRLNQTIAGLRPNS